ncbi:MAG: class I SAM-dependent methyltransferase [Candidatus Moranbacteria bacterium]|nr:class I SAM-dependent methyltransferase [Candidatus Moranbacteria bacterium]
MSAVSTEFKCIEVSYCPICQLNNSSFLIKKYDDRFGQPDYFEYYYCVNCNIAFLKNKIAEEYLPELYKKYYGKDKQLSAKSSKLKLVLEKIGLDKIIFNRLAGNKFLLNNVRKNSNVLEIGSGYSSELKKIIFLKKLDWTGLEVDEDSVARLKRDDPKAIHGTIKLNNIQDKFDYIISSQSLEHQHDINYFFENSKKFIKNGGKIIFTTPNFDSRYRKKYGGRWINWHTPYHITILSKRGIENLCERHGFVVSKFFTYTPTSWYTLQKKFEIPKLGELNTKFNFKFSLVGQLFSSIFLRFYEFLDKTNGDCIYCEIKIKTQ